jgi:hypothetical protein
MKKAKPRVALNKPIVFIAGFNGLTLAVFATAPVAWDSPNVAWLYALVLVSQAAIIWGFYLGRVRGLAGRPHRTLPAFSGRQVLPYLLLFYAVTFTTSYGFRMGFSAFDVRGMFELLSQGVADRNYGYTMALRGTGLGPIPWSIYFLISIVNQVFFAAGFSQLKAMQPAARLAFAAFVGIEAYFSLGRGTAFGLVSLATTFLLGSMLWMKGRIASILLVTCLFAGTVTLFSYNLYRRSGDVERRVELTEFGASYALIDHPAFAIVPPALHPAYLNVVMYFCGGYYHASLALDLDFQSTWLLGSNPALVSLASTAGIDVWERTFMYRLQVARGIDAVGQWHSAYTWIASDVSFYGVPLVLFGIAYLFGFSWAKALQGDFLSAVVFVVLGNILLFLFANMTYLSTVFYSFLFLMPFWLATRFIRIGPRPDRRALPAQHTPPPIAPSGSEVPS